MTPAIVIRTAGAPTALIFLISVPSPALNIISITPIFDIKPRPSSDTASIIDCPGMYFINPIRTPAKSMPTTLGILSFSQPFTRSFESASIIASNNNTL